MPIEPDTTVLPVDWYSTGAGLRRIAVPGGWIYASLHVAGMCFVPHPPQAITLADPLEDARIKPADPIEPPERSAEELRQIDDATAIGAIAATLLDQGQRWISAGQRVRWDGLSESMRAPYIEGARAVLATLRAMGWKPRP